MNTKLLYALVVAVAGLACRADTVYLTNGTEADGTIIEETVTAVVIRRPNGTVQSFRRGDVDAVVYDKKAPAAAAKPAEAVRPAPEPKKAASAPKGDEAKPAAAAGTPEQGEAKTKEGETKPGEAAAAPKEGAAKPGEAAAAPKEGAAKPGETVAAPKEGAAKPGEAAAAPKEGVAAKPAEAGKKEGAAETAAESGKDESKAKETAEGDEEKEKVLTSPPGPSGLSNFPDNVKRMKKDKEEKFMALLKQMGLSEKEKRTVAKAEVAAMGTAVLPYVVAGSYSDNVDARTLCMSLIGELNGRNAIKQVVELFYAAMPYSDQAEDFQVPFIQAIKTTLTVITGQSFITVETDMPGVQEGLKQYIDWYNKNMDRLPPQLGEKAIEPTDPDYADKIKAGRTLKLEKKSWPRPTTAADLIEGTKPNNRATPTVDDMTRRLDKTFEKSIPMIPFEDIGKRGSVR